MRERLVAIACDREASLGDVLPRLGEGADSALAEGRVFIGARRAMRFTDVVHAGEEVRVYPPRQAGAESASILAEQGGIVAAYKPAEMATIADHRGARGTLADEVERLLGGRERNLTPTSRLDVGVSGVVLFARDEAARRALVRAREEGRYLRHYVALAEKAPLPEHGVWSAPIGRDRDPRRRRVGGRGAVDATTAFATVEKAPRAALLAVEPGTGRTHQIRVHAAHARSPLLGDAVYGGPVRIVSATGAVRAITRIALHAAWVEVSLGARQTLRVDAPVPAELALLWTASGGEPSAWGAALALLRETG
ncbi:MAG TPA: RNA pseudouridine synthase [Polyangiaceae bacterium]|nr:RNA pseudouridine synthase [Polyangiaceae bacterium]